MIVGTALGGLALWGMHNRRGFDGYGAPVAAGVAAGVCADALYVERKECQDVAALTAAFYNQRIQGLEERFADRSVINGELFNLYKSQVDADFGLYKNQRDQFDVLKAEIDNLKCHVAVTDAIAPYQNQILKNEIECCCKEANWKIALEAERRECQGQRIVAYSNGIFATQGVAQPTFSTTITPKHPFNPLCCDCNC